jgi:hypothetical protein
MEFLIFAVAMVATAFGAMVMSLYYIANDGK